MSIIRFDPMRGFESIARKMSDIAGEFDKGVSFEYGSFSPRIDISEDDKNIYVHAELPGVKKEDVKVSINDDNIIIIKGEKRRHEKFEEKNEEICCIRAERSYGEFSRSFMLPDNVKRDNVNAKYENGILNIILEKAEPEKPKEVEINIS